jgi:hypothetical protein
VSRVAPGEFAALEGGGAVTQLQENTRVRVLGSLREGGSFARSLRRGLSAHAATTSAWRKEGSRLSESHHTSPHMCTPCVGRSVLLQVPSCICRCEVGRAASYRQGTCHRHCCHRCRRLRRHCRDNAHYTCSGVRSTRPRTPTPPCTCGFQHDVRARGPAASCGESAASDCHSITSPGGERIVVHQTVHAWVGDHALRVDARIDTCRMAHAT